MKESSTNPTSPRLGGITAAFLFVVVLASYVIQSQLTQHVQADLQYRQPYLLFYIAHCSFTIIFPLHLLLLTNLTGIPASSYTSGLRIALAEQLDSNTRALPLGKFLALVLALTAGVTVPSLSWYVSVSLTSLSDVTALFNTNAFWAYALCVLISNDTWRFHKLLAVLLSTAGVFVIVYGTSSVVVDDPSKRSLIGDALVLVGSFAYAVYEVLYKKYVALSETQDSDGNLTPSSPIYQRIGSTDSTLSTPSLLALDPPPSSLTVCPPPFGLYPNFLTSSIGLCTILVLWIPLPILHYTNIEPFALPSNANTWFYVLGIACFGVLYNSGFLVLLGIWGPVLASVGNLLTIVLIVLSDIFFRGKTVGMYSLVGCGMIISAFAILAGDVVRSWRKRESES